MDGIRALQLIGGVKCRVEMEQDRLEWEAARVAVKVRVEVVREGLPQDQVECVCALVAGRRCRISAAHRARASAVRVAGLL